MTASAIGVDWRTSRKPAARARAKTGQKFPGETSVMSSTVEPSGAIEIAPIEDTSLLAFYRDMNLPERRTFWACAAGWALDGMDFMIYPLVIGTIIALWKVDPGTAGLAGTVTLLASAIGGWLGGYLADRIGRVKTLQLTILWFSVFSLVCAFVQNFDQLLIARALLGLGFGGEWAAGAVLMGEAIRPQYRGRAVGSVQSGWAVGWGLAVLSQAILFSYLPPEIAWRWMFAIGALPALLVFFLRRYVEEPEIAAATLRQAGRERRAAGAVGDFLRPDSQDHDPGVADGDGMPGRLLRHHLLGAALSHHRAQALDRQFDRLSRGADHRLVRRLSGRRLARRPHRPAQSVPDLLARRHRRGPALHPIAADQRDAVAARLPARLLRVGLFLRRRRVPHRTLSDPAARIGPGLLLQFRPRHRRAVSVPGRRALDRRHRSPTPSRSLRCWPTACSSSPPSRCRKRAAGSCMRMRERLLGSLRSRRDARKRSHVIARCHNWSSL